MINRLALYQQLLTTSRDHFRSLVGIIQTTSGEDKELNFKKNKQNIESCVQRGAKLICLPENFHYMPRTYQETVDNSEALSGQTIKRYKQIALDNRVWLCLGGFAETCKFNPEKRHNTSIIINEEGNIVQKYRKLHLFDIDLTHKGGVQVAENKYIEPGKIIPDPIISPIGYLGLSISNDLRYPELYRNYVAKGAQVLIVSSAFYVKTGAAHWEPLLRARAIENQCYVIAVDQVGVHNDKAQSYGHSMVVDPWGDIIGQMSDKEGYFICEIDLDYLDKVRGNMAVLTQMRTDIMNK
eukprot:403344171